MSNKPTVFNLALVSVSYHCKFNVRRHHRLEKTVSFFLTSFFPVFPLTPGFTWLYSPSHILNYSRYFKIANSNPPPSLSPGPPPLLLLLLIFILCPPSPPTFLLSTSPPGPLLSLWFMILIIPAMTSYLTDDLFSASHMQTTHAQHTP